jgi:hypothetical protein
MGASLAVLVAAYGLLVAAFRASRRAHEAAEAVV